MTNDEIKNRIKKRLRANWKTIKQSVPDGVNVERLINIAVTAIEANDRIAQCSFESVIDAVTLAVTVGIEPNDGTGRAWFIPRKNRCCYELGFKGHCDLMYKSGRVAVIEGHAVFSNDEFSAMLGTDATIVHKPAMKDRGDLIGAYAVVWLHGTNRALVEVLTADDMAKIRRMSRANSGPWFDWPEEMARAKAIRRISKRAPVDATSRRALIAMDESEARVAVEDVFDDPWKAFKKDGDVKAESKYNDAKGIHSEEPPEDWQPNEGARDEDSR